MTIRALSRADFNRRFVFGLKRSDLKHLALIWLLFTSTAPFQFFAAIPYHPYKVLALASTLLMVLSIDFNNIRNANRIILAIIAIQFLYSLLAAFLQGFIIDIDYLYFNLSIQLVVDLVCYIYVKQFYSIDKISISVVYAMALMAVLGSIVVILGFLVNLQPFATSLPVEGYREFNNYILTFSSSVPDWGSFSIIRSSGYFDEPGAFAYYIVFALLLNKLYNYSKKLEILLLMLGFCTVSLAYIVSFVLYILLFGIGGRRSKYFFLILAIISSAAIYIYQDRESSDVSLGLYQLTIERTLIEETSDTKLVHGDNRTENLISSKEAFLKSPLIGHGQSAHNDPRSEFAGRLCCNILYPVAAHGIIGLLIFFAIFFYWGLYIIFHRPFDTTSFGAFVILLANMFQRPGFQDGSFGYLLFVFLLEATIWRRRWLRAEIQQSVLDVSSRARNAA